MSTTIDDLIAVKDEAVSACHAVMAAWENGDLADAARACEDAVALAERYDAAEEDGSVDSLAEWEDIHGEES